MSAEFESIASNDSSSTSKIMTPHTSSTMGEEDGRETLLEHTQEDTTSTVTSPAINKLSSTAVINVHSIYRNDRAEHEALLHKLTWRLLPFLMILYTFSFLDRSNLGNVHKAMLADIHMSEDEYGSAASIFFIPYVLLEVPSNMILERFDARRWLARIIFTWGLISTLMLAIQNHAGLMGARFLLGVAEAGFFPGIIFYLTMWFTPPERAQRLAFIFVAQPIAGILGGLLAYPILNYLDGVGGLAGWRWVFLLEGTPTVFLGVATWYYLPANPMEAFWLTLEERTFLTARMKGVSAHGGEEHEEEVSPSAVGSLKSSSSTSRPRSDSQDNGTSSGESGDEAVAFNQTTPISGAEPTTPSGTPPYSGGFFVPATIRARLELAYASSKAELKKLYRTTFSNKIIYLCILTNFLILMPVQAITLYLPSIVAEIGVGSLAGNLISAIPYGVASVSMFFVSHYSDRTGDRARPIIICNCVGFIFMGATAFTMSSSDASSSLVFWQLFFLSLTASGVWSCKPALMALFTTNLQGNIAVAIAAVTTVGNVSGIVAPLIMSGLRSQSGTYSSGCFFLMTCLVLASWTVMALNREIHKVQQRKVERHNQELETIRQEQVATQENGANQLDLQSAVKNQTALYSGTTSENGSATASSSSPPTTGLQLTSEEARHRSNYNRENAI